MALLREKHPLWELALLLLIIFCSAAIFMLIAVAGLLFYYSPQEVTSVMQDLSLDTGNINILKWVQGVTSTGTFLVPPLIFAWVIRKYPADYLKINNKSRFILYLTTFFIVITAFPFIHYLLQLNNQISLPEGWEWIENWMRQKEDAAEEMILAFLEMETIPQLMVNLLIMAAIPAVGEELLFRGVLQQLFRRWFKNIHIAILVAAILFSAIHIQFFGFIPRMVLGIFFGYLFYWSGSIWIPIFAHFINNGFQIVAYYFNQQGFDAVNVTEMEQTPLQAVLISAILLSVFLYLFYRMTKHDHKTA